MKQIVLFASLLLSLLTHTSIHAIEKSKISFEGSPNNTDVGVLPACGELSITTGKQSSTEREQQDVDRKHHPSKMPLKTWMKHQMV